jgi:pectin methylesterase-like acyl-CoA thioesterase
MFKVQNLEMRPITEAQVVIVIEPSGYQSYLIIQNQTVHLLDLHGRDADTGLIEVVISAAGAPAKEALYTVKEYCTLKSTNQMSESLNLELGNHDQSMKYSASG